MKLDITDAITINTIVPYLMTLPSLHEGETIRLDFAQVTTVDSSVLSYILHMLRLAKKGNHLISLEQLPKKLIDLATLYDLYELLQPHIVQTQ